MNKEEAKKLVVKTFEQSFDESRFLFFIKNLLKDLDETKAQVWAGNYIPESFRNAIKFYKRIGQYTDINLNVIDVLIVNVKKDITLERARTLQRNFIARHLKQRTHEAALVAFYTDDYDDWRYSLVVMDLNLTKTKVEIEFTPAKRYSFLVGINEKSHTAQNQFVNLLNDKNDKPTLKNIEESFNIETVTKEFFLEYRDLFIRTKRALDGVLINDEKVKTDFDNKGIDSVSFSKKLIGQIVFLYFLQKKGWFGVARDDKWGEGSKKFLRELFDGKHGGYNNFFNDILEPLFYEALRIDRSHDDHYYSRFNCKIPFLNGGLFDPIGKDGGYDWVKTDITLPNELFSNKTKKGDYGNGIFDTFDLYNFTVIEDEPLEKEVAIDPELLGKAYEKFNAIRSDNFEEYLKVLKSGEKGDESKFNKQYGVFYTPREIVHYLCQQSLINYLAIELEGKVSKDSIEFLILDGDKFIEHLKIAKEKNEENENYKGDYKENKSFIELKENAEDIDKLLANVKLCDPAVGSGAFPVGMMTEIVKARMFFVLTECLTGEYSNNHNEQVNRNPYSYKRECIENSLYGVDIDIGAVEIAKLRLWLSLVVDEDDIIKIKPLPNLDYKIICGNSLMSYPYKPLGLNEIEKLKQDYIIETNPSKKKLLREQIDLAIYGLYQNSENKVGYKITMDFKINFSEVFHINDGFDILIANPPYISISKLPKIYRDDLSKQNFKTYSKGSDLYCLFFEQGFNLLKETGILAYISSNRFCFTNYGIGLRKYLSVKNILILINLNEINVFESANVGSLVSIIQNSYPKDNKLLVNEIKGDLLQDNLSLDGRKVIRSFYQEHQWSFDDTDIQTLKNKIIKRGVPFSNWKGITINRGITTGANNIFIIDEKKRNELIEEDPNSQDIIAPVLRGGDIKRYYIDKPNQYLIYSYTGIIISKYPAVFNYLEKHKKELKEVYEAKHNQKKWFELRKCSYYDKFKLKKLVWTRLSSQNTFSISIDGEFTVDSSSFAVGESIEYLASILNSKVIFFYFKHGSVIWGKEGIKWFGNYFDSIPIPIINKDEQKPFKMLVEKILEIKKNNPQTKTKKLEDQIDLMVYKLYDLTYEEVKIIDPNIEQIISGNEYEKTK